MPVTAFLEVLEVSLATFKRDLEYLRDRKNMPIEVDREARGYRYTSDHDHTAALPGLWFNASEVYALLTMQHLLANLGTGLLSTHIAPLQNRLKALLGSAGRTLPSQCFETIATATLRRKRLQITHYSRQTGQESTRTISSRQLLLYRNNWHADPPEWLFTLPRNMRATAYSLAQR